MPSLGNRAFEARVEGVAREEGNEGGLPLISRMESVLVDDSLKASHSPRRLRRSGSEIMVVRVN